MPVELVISPPATGKTETCIQRIRSLLLEQPFAPVWLVLPDRLQTTAFRRRLAEAGGAIGVKIGTFENLYRELLERSGKPVPVASPPIVHRLVRAAVEGVHAEGGLQYYHELRQTPGFALVLREVFAELKRALVFPETFAAQASAGSPAQQELARLYLAFQDHLQRFNWADPEGLSWLAVEALQNHPNLPAGIALLVVDGFDSFTGAQRKALQLLSLSVENLLITLPGEIPFRRSAHRRFHNAYQRLLSEWSPGASPPLITRGLPSRSFLPPALQHIEERLFGIEGRVSTEGATLRLIEARSPAEEAREALRWLKACILRQGVPLQSCAVVTPNPDLYHPYLRQASAEFGIPLNFTQGELLSHSPAAAVLLELLNLPVLNYPRRMLLDIIRSPYFDLSSCGLQAGSADILDEISRFGQVIEGREQWEEVFDRLEQSSPPPEMEVEDDLRVPSLPRGERIAPLREALGRFFDRLAPSQSSRSLTDWIVWLEDLLDEWRYYELGIGERDQAAFEHLRQILRALVLGEAVTGWQPLSYARFVAELQGALEGTGYQEPLPNGQPAVIVLRMMEARGVRFQAVAIMGLSEGIFPAVERADPFLDEKLRQSLGLESRLQLEQPGLFYQAVTRADRCLLLTRPYLADDGEKWEASPYWKAVLRLLPENSVQTIRPDDPRPLNDAASPQEVLFWGVRRGSLPQAFRDLLPRWESLGHARDVLHARQANAPAGPYEGFAGALQAVLQARYGAEHIWSASRLEAYGACPYQFFISSALGLEAKAPPELGLDAAQLGTILHAVLEAAYAAADNPADPTAVLAVLPAIARREFERAPQELGFRPSPLWEIEQEQLLLALETAVENLAVLDAEKSWLPVAFERSFGQRGAPPLAIQLEGQRILLRGVVDRVDRNPNGGLRIIDYKTGSSHLSRQDLILGRRLQLPLYALAAEHALGLGKVEEGFYWALLRGEAGALKLSSFKDGEAVGLQAASAVALEHVARIVDGIRQAQFPPLPPKGGCPSYCPVSAWCWRYAPEWGA